MDWELYRQVSPEDKDYIDHQDVIRAIMEVSGQVMVFTRPDPAREKAFRNLHDKKWGKPEECEHCIFAKKYNNFASAYFDLTKLDSHGLTSKGLK